MKKIPSDFTLTGLASTVSIIGILAVIMLPAYQDYTRSSRVAESLTLTNNIRATAAAHYSARGVWPADNLDAGLPTGTGIAGAAVKDLYTKNGVITIVFNETVQNGKQLELSAVASSSSVEWTCRSSSDSRVVLDEKYLPPRCRS